MLWTCDVCVDHAGPTDLFVKKIFRLFTCSPVVNVKSDRFEWSVYKRSYKITTVQLFEVNINAITCENVP